MMRRLLCVLGSTSEKRKGAARCGASSTQLLAAASAESLVGDELGRGLAWRALEQEQLAGSDEVELAVGSALRGQEPGRPDVSVAADSPVEDEAGLDLELEQQVVSDAEKLLAEALDELRHAAEPGLHEVVRFAEAGRVPEAVQPDASDVEPGDL